MGCAGEPPRTRPPGVSWNATVGMGAKHKERHSEMLFLELGFYFIVSVIFMYGMMAASFHCSNVIRRRREAKTPTLSIEDIVRQRRRERRRQHVEFWKEVEQLIPESDKHDRPYRGNGCTCQWEISDFSLSLPDYWTPHSGGWGRCPVKARAKTWRVFMEGTQ